MGVPLLTRVALIANVAIAVPPLMTLVLGPADPRVAFALPYWAMMGLDPDVHSLAIRCFCAGCVGVMLACVAALLAIFSGSTRPEVGAVPLVGATVFNASLFFLLLSVAPNHETYGKGFVTALSLIGVLSAHFARWGGARQKTE